MKDKAVDMLLIPMNIGNTHWFLACVRLGENSIEFYDSSESGRNNYLYYGKHINYLLTKLYRSGGMTPPPFWEVRSMRDGVAVQNDIISCGVFMCSFALRLACGARPPFDLDGRDALWLRERIAADCLHKRATPPPPPPPPPPREC